MLVPPATVLLEREPEGHASPKGSGCLPCVLVVLCSARDGVGSCPWEPAAAWNGALRLRPPWLTCAHGACSLRAPYRCRRLSLIGGQGLAGLPCMLCVLCHAGAAGCTKHLLLHLMLLKERQQACCGLLGAHAARSYRLPH